MQLQMSVQPLYITASPMQGGVRGWRASDWFHNQIWFSLLLALCRIVIWWNCHLKACRCAVGHCFSGTCPRDQPTKADPTRSKLQMVTLSGSLGHTSTLTTTRSDPEDRGRPGENIQTRLVKLKLKSKKKTREQTNPSCLWIDSFYVHKRAGGYMSPLATA